MTNNTLRRIACLVTLLALVALPAPSLRPAVSVANGASAPIVVTDAAVSRKAGRGWGAMLGCAGCLVAGGLVVAGGPASILIAVNTPGSAIALLACAGSCYEALAY